MWSLQYVRFHVYKSTLERTSAPDGHLGLIFDCVSLIYPSEAWPPPLVYLLVGIQRASASAAPSQPLRGSRPARRRRGAKRAGPEGHCGRRKRAPLLAAREGAGLMNDTESIAWTPA